MKALQMLDNTTSGILVTGAIASSAINMSGKADTKKLKQDQKLAMQIFYGVVGAASIYKAIRAMTPTKEEKRLQKFARLYNQAESYQRRAMIYRKAAGTFLNRNLNSLKKAKPLKHK